MKFVYILSIIGICFCCSIEAAPEAREKRAVSQEKCPFDTDAKCIAYINQQIKQHRCMGAVGIRYIEWQTCGISILDCGPGFRVAGRDLTKPYPECCLEHCVEE